MKLVRAAFADARVRLYTDDDAERMPDRAALLLGLNYDACRPAARLRGCIEDVRSVSAALVAAGRFRPEQIEVLTDDTAAGRAALTLKAIKRALLVLSRRTRSERLAVLYVHFSGHAVQVPDYSSDEVDGFDECLLAEDFEAGGLLKDDWLRVWLQSTNPATRVVFTIDACHSGSALDLYAMTDRRVLCLSGSLDSQTAAESASGSGSGPGPVAGALTSRALAVLAATPAAWDDVELLRSLLAKRLRDDGFSQTPVVTAAHDVAADPVFLPAAHDVAADPVFLPAA